MFLRHHQKMIVACWFVILERKIFLALLIYSESGKHATCNLGYLPHNFKSILSRNTAKDACFRSTVSVRWWDMLRFCPIHNPAKQRISKHAMQKSNNCHANVTNPSLWPVRTPAPASFHSLCQVRVLSITDPSWEAFQGERGAECAHGDRCRTYVQPYDWCTCRRRQEEYFGQVYDCHWMVCK